MPWNADAKDEASLLSHEVALGPEAIFSEEDNPMSLAPEISVKQSHCLRPWSPVSRASREAEISFSVIEATAALRLCDLPPKLTVTNDEIGNVCEEF